MIDRKQLQRTKWAPTSFKYRIITPPKRGYSLIAPVTHFFSAIYRGSTSISKWGLIFLQENYKKDILRKGGLDMTSPGPVYPMIRTFKHGLREFQGFA